MTTNRNPTLQSLTALVLGLLIFAGGVTLARLWLPEWCTGPLRPKAFFTGRFQELAQRMGAKPAAGEPQASLDNREKDLEQEPQRLDAFDPRTAADLGGGLLIEVHQPATVPGIRQSQELIVELLPSGEPLRLHWGTKAEEIKTAISGQHPFPPAQQTAWLQTLLRPGESLGKPVPSTNAKGVFTFYPIVGSQPPQRIATTTNTDGVFLLQRQLGDMSRKNAKAIPSDIVGGILTAVPVVLGVFIVLGTFLVLLGKRRIDFASGLRMALFLLAVAAIGILIAEPTWTGLLTVLGACFLCLWAFVMWSTSESFLRAVMPGMMPELDTLRAGHLGPRGGNALVLGVSVGMILAGLRLAALATASCLPGVWSQEHSLSLPIFRETTPFYEGALIAAGIALALGLAYRFLPSRWAPWAAVLVAGLAIPVISLRPVGWQLAVDLAAAGLLVLAGRRGGGLAAILTAAFCARLLPAAAFSGLHPAWLPGSLAVCAGFPLLLLALGVVGMGRPEQAEQERLKQPAFIRRLEEERRISYEMDLLARMQLGLLPSSLPDVPGWEIAVRSLLATEAGGDLYDFLRDEQGNLWIAAGDVAGHGYSCAIVQAMTAAALTSIITAERSPSEVLQGVDRVIRRGGSHRNFTSLALVCLNLETGEVTMSNAGHPFPLLLAHDGDVEEISLPGLPLGQGPQRRYVDFSFEIPPGGALVFCSDGLFEATDPAEVQYGYERPRDLLRKLGDRPAPGILAALLDDWRAYMRSDEPPADDTTVLVLKRL